MGPGWGQTHRHVAVQGAQEMLGGTDKGAPKGIHCLHGLGQSAGGEEDQPLCCIPGHSRDLLHTGDAGGTGALQVMSHTAHQSGAVLCLPRDTMSWPCPCQPLQAGQGWHWAPHPLCNPKPEHFQLAACKSHRGPLQQGHSLSPFSIPPHSQAPGEPPSPAALPLHTEAKGSNPDLLLPVPMSQQSCCWGQFPAPPAPTDFCCWDHGGRIFQGCSGATRGVRC